MQSSSNPSQRPNSLLAGNLAGNFLKKALPGAILASKTRAGSIAYDQIPCSTEQGIFLHEQGILSREQGILRLAVSVRCSHACFAPAERDLFSRAFFAGEVEQMADGERSRERYGEAFWLAHHEAWRRSDLNQREYSEAQGLPLKAFGNWRGEFKGVPLRAVSELLSTRARGYHDHHSTLKRTA